LPEDVYATVDSCETAKEIWECVRQMMKGSDIGKQEKKAKLFNEWEKFTSTNGELIESYYHRFMIDKFRMLKEMAGINLDSMLVKWHRISKGIANQSGTGNVVVARAEGTGIGNQARCYNYRGLAHIARNCIARPRRRDATYLQTQLLIAQKEEARIQLQAKEFDFMDAAGDLDEIEEVNANYGSAKVHLNDNCYDNEIFNMFTREEQYTDLLDPIPELQLVPQNDNHVTSVAPSMSHSGGTVETSSAPNEEIRAHQETVYRNLVDQVAQKQQSLYNGNLLLKEHDLPIVYDSEEILEFAQESREKMRLLKKEIKFANYAKINHLSGVFVPQTTKSKEELFLSNVSNMVTISKTISIPNEDLSNDTTPSVAQKVQNFKIQFLQEAAKFVRDFKSLAKDADESLDKQNLVDVPSDLQTELDRTKENFELCIIKKEKEYAVLWNNWYTKCEECKYDKISYDKAYNDMQQKVERLQAQLRDFKEFQVVNYEREISHLKTTYKNLFDSIKSNQAHAKLHDLIFENAKLRARLFENTYESVKNISGTSVTPHVDKPKLSAVTPLSKKLHASNA
nr:hypothetical protein [Tanacetum cinerariifolium]